MKSVPTVNMDQASPATSTADCPQYYSAAEIALAIGTPGEAGKKMVKRTAASENWPARMLGNKLVFVPPAHIASIIVAAPAPVAETTAPLVRYSDLNHSEQARALVLMRERAVLLVQETAPATGKEAALNLIAAQMQRENPLFRVSLSSLRKWCDRYAASGLDGLVEQKRGRVGRKSYASQLQETNLLAAAASSVERGIKGRLNVARGYRDSLLNNPTIEGSSRMWMHGAHASKSYVPPSIRTAIRDRVSPLATRLIQIGPKAAKLDGPYTECNYEKMKAGMTFTCDDMTANCYVWAEWPNEDGWILVRPQILAAMDVGSMAWLNIRAVIRSKGQYTKDDVWGLIGDVFDSYGLFQTAILEGGTWQSNLVRGHKTGIEDEARFGGLKSLGVKLIHTRSPRGKIIETAFNSLQHAADHVRGFCGRMEMKDCPEIVRQQLALVRAGKSHPSQYFLHISDYTKHLEQVMNNLNHERNDGTILRGRCPSDKWSEDAPQMPIMPDSHKWMYRAAYRVLQVTRNGIRITVGSGKYQTHYTYSSQALENHRGRRVVAYWNDYDPDTDIVVYSLSKGSPDKFICVASRVATLDRLGASEEDIRADAMRKKLSLQHARTQRATLAPFLTRQAVQIPVADPGTVGPQIQAARDRASQAAQARANIARFSGDIGELIQEFPPDAEAAPPLKGAPPMAEAVPSQSSQDEQICDLNNISDLLI